MKKILSFLHSYPIDMFFLVFLYISQLYYSYRYIFKVNSKTTSPTYADTSVTEKIIKYIITFLLYVLILGSVLLVQKYKGKLKEIIAARKYFLVYLGVFFVYLLVDMLALHGISLKLLKSSVAYDYLLKFIIFVPFVLIPLFLDKELLKRYWMHFLYLSFIFQAVYTAIELFLYTFAHRLPALAYAGGTIRYGGAWDDPNGVSLFYILFIVFLIFYEDKLSTVIKYILLAIAIYLLFLALSFTSLILLVLVCIVAFIWKRKKYAVVLLGILCAFSLFELMTPSGFQSAIMSKIPSAQEHFYAIFDVKLPPVHIETGKGVTVPAVVYPKQPPVKVSILNRIFGQKQPIFSEDFYSQYMKNFGLLGFGMLLILFAFVFRRIFSDMFTFSAFLFVVLSIIGNIGIPFLQVFPVNVYFWICFGMVIMYGVFT